MPAMAQRDYYEILGVSRTATPDQIRSAYRKLARKHHPDVNKARDAADKFKEATAAYEVLSDPEKRKAYDQFGHAGPGFGGFGGAGGARRPGGGYTWTSRGGPAADFDFEDVFSSSPFSGMSLEELMESLGGGGRRGGRRGRAERYEPGPDVEHHVTLDFLQAVRGTTTALELAHEDGSAERIEVKIPPGVREGSRIRVRGKGYAGPGGRGDLYIIARVREHPYFRREGSDIYIDLPVSVTEAALGAEVTAPTVDGPVELKVPPGSSSGVRLRMRGRGAPDPKTGARGDQYAVVKIVLPKTLSEKGRGLLEEFGRAERYDPRERTPW